MTDYSNKKPIASTDQFKKALLAVRDDRKIKLSAQDISMLRAHCRAENHLITATNLAIQTQLTNFSVANLQYGKLAHKIADKIPYDPPKRKDRSTRWWFTLSYGLDGSDETDQGHFTWVMRPELVKALQEMKWA